MYHIYAFTRDLLVLSASSRLNFNSGVSSNFRALRKMLFSLNYKYDFVGCTFKEVYLCITGVYFIYLIEKIYQTCLLNTNSSF